MNKPERIVNVIKQLVEIAAEPCENCTRLEAANARLRAAASKARQNREARNLRLRVKAEKQRQARQHAAAKAQAAEPDHSADAGKKVCARQGCTNPVIPPRRQYCSMACCRKATRNQSHQRAAETTRAVELNSTDKAIRICLRCNARFPSWGPGNRICPACTKKGEAWPSMTMRRGRFVGKMA